jgi:ElaB/YqjD/DUF883 family membrane-anchored ribosome-binding protein
MNDITREQVASDVRQVLDDVQALLSQAAQASGQQAQELRNRAAEELQRAQVRLEELQHRLAERSRAAMHVTDDWVQAHPWGAVALGGSVGFLIGLLVSRR